MPDDTTGDLQFERAMPVGSDGPVACGIRCVACRAAIPDEYYDVNGHVVCERCRNLAEFAAGTPAGLVPLATAAGLGFAAAVAGAAVYYAVIAITNLEIGLVALLCGYMVGYGVRKGARGRGGLRFQVLAVVLTYFSVALAYTPVVVTQVLHARATTAAGTSSSAGASRPRPGPATIPAREPSLLTAIEGVAMLAGFIFMLPLVMIVSSFPSGLFSGFIIGLGMRQAWKMTGVPLVVVFGPYRVRAAEVPAKT
jgi:hypothetical protein